MSQSPTDKPAILDYATTSHRGSRLADALLWLTPIWCALVIAATYWPKRHHDDAFWYAAILLSFAAFLLSASRSRRGLAWYCLIVCLVVLAVALLLPSWNRAT